VKLAPLLASYLYINKRLELPGLGVFVLDPTIVTETEAKAGKPVNIEGISFESKPSIKESPDLVQFIATRTGKLKALAAADLDSHLELTQQFLNIGKPFLFEGIGNLVKLHTGKFVFTSGQVVPELMSEYSPREINSTTTTEDSFGDYKEIFYPKKTKARWVKPIPFLLLLCGVGLAIWGGYTVYKKSSKPEVIAEPEPEKVIVAPPVEDSAAIAARLAAANQRKVVLEEAYSKWAFYRYKKLKKDHQWPVQMETNDSMLYKLYVMMPVNIADTTRLLDSLTRMNGKRVYIEN
jgi:hypothetical protein